MFYPAASEPELTASWEKGLTYVAEGSITEQEYMDKLEHFVRYVPGRWRQAIISITCGSFFDAAAVNYRKPERAPDREERDHHDERFYYQQYAGSE